MAELETSVAEALEEASQTAEPETVALTTEVATAAPVAELTDDTRVAEAEIITATASAPLTAPAPQPRPATITLTALDSPTPDETAPPEVVTRMSTSGGRHWGGVNVGVMTTRHQAERLLLKTALNELGTLDEALRKVVKRPPDGWHANFVGLSEEAAELACRRLEARTASCKVIGPS